MASSIPRLGAVASPHLGAARIQKPHVVDGDHLGARGDSLSSSMGRGERRPPMHSQSWAHRPWISRLLLALRGVCRRER